MAISLKSFARIHRIGMSCKRESRNPNMAIDKWSRGASHYNCKLRKGRKTMTVHFSMGSALTGPPKKDDVLNSMQMDCMDFNGVPNYEDWAGDYGYPTNKWDDPDGYKDAKHTYSVVKRQCKRLGNFLGQRLYTKLKEAESL